MKSYRGNAIAVGVLFILCSAAAILSIVPLGATVGGPVDFATLAGSGDAVVMTALIEFVWAATGMGIAIALYPVLRLFNPTLALGSVAGRVVENVFILVGTLSLLALLTVSQQAASSAAPSSFQATGDALVAVREWAPGFVAGLAFVVGTFMYNLRDVQIETRSPMAVGLGSCWSRLEPCRLPLHRLHPGLRLHDREQRSQRPDRSPGDGLGRVVDSQGIQSVGCTFDRAGDCAFDDARRSRSLSGALERHGPTSTFSSPYDASCDALRVRIRPAGDPRNALTCRVPGTR